MFRRKRTAAQERKTAAQEIAELKKRVRSERMRSLARLPKRVLLERSAISKMFGFERRSTSPFAVHEEIKRLLSGVPEESLVAGKEWIGTDIGKIKLSFVAGSKPELVMRYEMPYLARVSERGRKKTVVPALIRDLEKKREECWFSNEVFHPESLEKFVRDERIDSRLISRTYFRKNGAACRHLEFDESGQLVSVEQFGNVRHGADKVHSVAVYVDKKGNYIFTDGIWRIKGAEKVQKLPGSQEKEINWYILYSPKTKEFLIEDLSMRRHTYAGRVPFYGANLVVNGTGTLEKNPLAPSLEHQEVGIPVITEKNGEYSFTLAKFE